MKEIWEYIPDCEGRILVSNYGRCKYSGKSATSKGTRNNRGGYYVKHYIDNNGKNHHVLMSRLVASVFIPNPENKPQVDHIDGDVSNNRADNLRWVYPLENARNSVTQRNRKELKLFRKKVSRQNVKVIYPELTKDTAFGFLTRGCPRGCHFCIVEKKEGKCSRKVADLKEFWNGQKNIVLCDPNILACKNWKELLQMLIDSKAVVDFNQGLDIRMMTEEKIEMLNQIKIKQIHFAWDRYQDKEKILPKFKLWSEFAKHKSTHNTIVYTIVNFDTTIEQDLDRIYTLREMGLWAYVMIYDKEHCSKIYKRLQRWVNNRFIFAKCKRFEDYNQKPTASYDNTPTLF